MALVAKVDAMAALYVPVAKACRIVGLSRATYYRIKGKGSDVPIHAEPEVNLSDDLKQQLRVQDTSESEAEDIGEANGGGK